MKPEDVETWWPDSDFTPLPVCPHVQATGEGRVRLPSPRMRGADPQHTGQQGETPGALTSSIAGKKACSALATSPPNPNIFHPFLPLLQQVRLCGSPLSDRTDRQTAGRPALKVTAKFPSKGAFAAKWLSNGCDLQIQPSKALWLKHIVFTAAAGK